MIIQVQPTTELRSRYKRLLIEEEWDISTARSLLELANDTLDPRIHFGWEGEPAPRTKNFEIPEGFSDHLKEYLAKFYSPVEELPAVPAIIPIRKKDSLSGLAHFATKLSIFMSLQMILKQESLEFEDRQGFYRDIQSLIFIYTIDHFLPLLKHNKMTGEHDYLLNVLQAHAVIVWQDEPAHSAHLKSMITESVGDKQATLSFLTDSFKLTPLIAHEFPTKAQAVILELIDQRKFDEAKDFAISFSRLAPLSLGREIKEMIDNIYERELMGRRRHPVL